jgi:hypothetical protein
MARTSYPGWTALRVIVEREREIERWQRYARRLTPEERRRIASGDDSPIIRPLEPEWKEGDWLKAASNLRIRVAGVRWRRSQYRTSFDVQDFRARLPRRVPQMFEPPDLDEHGNPIDPDDAAIEQARLEGNYTAAAALAVPSVGEAVPIDYERVINMDARDRWAEHKRLERAEQQAREDAKRLAATVRDTLLMLARHGVDSSEYLAAIQRAAHAPPVDERGDAKT